jgi:hypothetical protein
MTARDDFVRGEGGKEVGGVAIQCDEYSHIIVVVRDKLMGGGRFVQKKLLLQTRVLSELV